MERKLATIRKIDELKPITFINKDTGLTETADAIQLAIVDGWQCVVLKSEFSKAGELCVYFEIDSIIPRESWNMHIQKDTLDKPIRLKTIKLKGYLSQGLALPLKSVIPTMGFFEGTGEFGSELLNEDVTEILKIEKYEAPISAELAGQSRGSFPGDIPKTDQQRIQNIPQILKENVRYEVSEKLEGSSCTIYTKNGDFGVCSRNINLIENETNSFWKMAHKYNLVEKLPELKDYIALQGELCGPGIQGNIYGLKDLEFFLYNIYDIREGRYWTPKERLEAVSVLGIKHVPIIELDFVPSEDIFNVLEMAEGLSQLAKVQREGLVFKSHDSSFSWKAISNKYLLETKMKDLKTIYDEMVTSANIKDYVKFTYLMEELGKEIERHYARKSISNVILNGDADIFIDLIANSTKQN